MNLEYPCLENGLIAQFPISLRLRKLVDSYEFRDGTTLKNASTRITRYSWTCQYSGLSDAELKTFEEFWAACNRGANAFRFYDPIGNLLRETENLTGNSWTKEAALDVVQLPSDGSWKRFLLTNSASTPTHLSQVVEVSPHFALVFSLKCSWEDPIAVGLQCASLSGTTANLQNVHEDTSCSLSLGKNAHASLKVISLEIPAHTQVIVSCPQLEISLKASGYTPSLLGGIFSRARILPSKFVVQTQAPNAHSVTISIESER